MESERGRIEVATCRWDDQEQRLELGTEKRENVGLGIEKREDRYLRRDMRSGNMEVKVRSGMAEREVGS